MDTHTLSPTELLPDPLDPVLTRPLLLHGGHAYAAAWPRVRLTGAHPGEAPTLSLVRDDGLISPALSPSDELVRLAAFPPLPTDRLWSTAGLRAYLAGRRPDPAQVFAALTAIFDRYLDFTRSLAPQPAMTELLAVYVLSTWFLPAFSTFSHLWILGDHGAGKSRLLHLLARLTYLGSVVPASAPAQPLRDLAALGAALAVDNADGLFASLLRTLEFRPGAATQRQSLFLAGARRDVLIPLRQRLTGRDQPAVYGLSHLDVFGPRLFVAQLPPHPSIATRALYVPLVRSADRARCLADPSRLSGWPMPPRVLIDDLWALALAHLPELPAHLAATATHTSLVGALSETWQPYLAVASWLNQHGVPGLLDRMRALAADYPRQTEALTPQVADKTRLTLRAIFGYVAIQINKMIDYYLAAQESDDSDVSDESAGESDDSDVSDESAGEGDDSDVSEEFDGEGDDSDVSDELDGESDDSDVSDESAGESDDSDVSGEFDGESDDSDVSDESDGPGDVSSDPVLVAFLRKTRYFFTPSMLLPVIRGQAQSRAWDDLADEIDPRTIGRVLNLLRITLARKNHSRQYTITLPELERLIDAYRLDLPPILAVYRRYAEETLRAEIPPGEPGAPLQPPSPFIVDQIAKFLGIKPRAAAAAAEPAPPPTAPSDGDLEKLVPAESKSRRPPSRSGQRVGRD